MKLYFYKFSKIAKFSYIFSFFCGKWWEFGWLRCLQKNTFRLIVVLQIWGAFMCLFSFRKTKGADRNSDWETGWHVSFSFISSAAVGNDFDRTGRLLWHSWIHSFEFCIFWYGQIKVVLNLTLFFLSLIFFSKPEFLPLFLNFLLSFQLTVVWLQSQSFF